ncbi:ROK family transcriptional regulator [Wansuia hejianensis]|uniref:ROK family transcriptional regulator n=1 Tax=Wansuia hejianensis TaxID=2763667 RepID=A0A7G9GG72_9FIRM|nr:ROK family transcriptional regulator [Wansuia hejianensis]QNM09804.1 ROK family transcriptional regulator [Wansuia hejianensis]
MAVISRGENQQLSKFHNRGLILKLICTNKGITRVQLTEMTNLAKMTITNIVTELIRSGVITEGIEKMNDNVGRNPIILEISTKAPKVIGVQITRDSCTAVLSDMQLNIVERYEEKLENENNESLLDKVSLLIRKILQHEENILGIGISSIGQWDVEQGLLMKVIDFWDIHDMPLRDFIEEKFHLPVYVNNDMNASALAEKLYGHGQMYHDFVYVGLTNGIGGGIVTNDEIYQLNNGLAGEIGHISIDYNGKPCACGNRGCLEMYASIPRIEEKLQEAVGQRYTFQQFCSIGNQQEVDQVFKSVMDKLSYALVSVVNMLNCQAIILGHGGYLIPDRYIRYLEENVNSKKVFKRGEVRVIKSSFSDEASLYGSICCVLNVLFEGKLLENLNELQNQ